LPAIEYTKAQSTRSTKLGLKKVKAQSKLSLGEEDSTAQASSLKYVPWYEQVLIPSSSCAQDQTKCDSWGIDEGHNCSALSLQVMDDAASCGDIPWSFRIDIAEALVEKCQALDSDRRSDTNPSGSKPRPHYRYKPIKQASFVNREIWTNRSLNMGISTADKNNWETLKINFFVVDVCKGDPDVAHNQVAYKAAKKAGTTLPAEVGCHSTKSHNKQTIAYGAWQILQCNDGVRGRVGVLFDDDYGTDYNCDGKLTMAHTDEIVRNTMANGRFFLANKILQPGGSRVVFPWSPWVQSADGTFGADCDTPR